MPLMYTIGTSITACRRSKLLCWTRCTCWLEVIVKGWNKCTHLFSIINATSSSLCGGILAFGVNMNMLSTHQLHITWCCYVFTYIAVAQPIVGQQAWPLPMLCGGTAAAAPQPFRSGNPALCGSRPLFTPYYCRLGDLLCFVFMFAYCMFDFSVYYLFFSTLILLVGSFDL